MKIGFREKRINKIEKLFYFPLTKKDFGIIISALVSEKNCSSLSEDEKETADKLYDRFLSEMIDLKPE